ncbi:Stf0 family sulfotransferase [Streptomyces canus]|uniref:Stf0 family sulfotransferase n=1 Tax=Streptomyces canus TaxID=58343 RepID=UPI0036795937
MHRIGIIGTGDIARKVYLPLLTGNPEVEIVALASRTRDKAEALARKYRLDTVVINVEEVLRRRPDIVFVHASTSAHFELVRACLDSGTHVYVDKPLSESFDETYRLEQQARAQGLLLAVGFNRRFAPMVRAAVEAVPNPSIIISEKHRMPLRPSRPFGTVYNDLIHAIDLACWAGSIPTDMVVQGSAGPWNGETSMQMLQHYLPGLTHFIFTQRRDAFAQAVSWAIAYQTDRWKSTDPDLGRKPSYDFSLIDALYQNTLADNFGWETWFKLNGVEPLRLTYEDIVEDPRKEILRSLKFLGLEAPAELSLVTRIEKQGTDLNRNWRDRYLADKARNNVTQLPTHWLPDYSG